VTDDAGKSKPDQRGRGGKSTDEQPDDLFAVRVRVSRDRVGELLRRGDLDFGDRPRLQSNADGTGSLYVFASRSGVEQLAGEGYQVDLGENISATGRQRAPEVGEGDRFEGGLIPPRGLGRKVPGPGGNRSRPGGGEPTSGRQP
jgi:hypothetical protein